MEEHVADHMLARLAKAATLREGTPEPSTQLTGTAATTHHEMTEAAKALAEVTKRTHAEMGAAQERFRKAMAAHLAAITGEQVTP